MIGSLRIGHILSPPLVYPVGKAYQSNSWTHELRTMAARFEKTGPTDQAFAPHILEA